jgi:hypothetical protein
MEKAINALLDQFCPNTTQIVDERDIVYQQIIQDTIVNEDPNPLKTRFNMIELKNCTRGLLNKAMGADRIHNKMLLHLSEENLNALLYSLNYIFQSRYILNAWKNAIVTPILKPRKAPENDDSYRPISLTSCLKKLMEKMVNNRIKWYLQYPLNDKVHTPYLQCILKALLILVKRQYLLNG